MGGGILTSSQFNQQKVRPIIVMNRPSISIKEPAAAGLEEKAAIDAAKIIKSTLALSPV
jgi:hypothetical protein